MVTARIIIPGWHAWNCYCAPITFPEHTMWEDVRGGVGGAFATPDQINLTCILTAIPDKNGSFFLNKLRKSQHSTLFGLKCTYLVTIFAHFGPKNDGGFFQFFKSFYQMSTKTSGNAVRTLAKIIWWYVCTTILKILLSPCIPSSACVEQPLKVLSIQ